MRQPEHVPKKYQLPSMVSSAKSEMKTPPFLGTTDESQIPGTRFCMHQRLDHVDAIERLALNLWVIRKIVVLNYGCVAQFSRLFAASISEVT